MTAKSFKELKETYTKKQIVWKIVKGDLVVGALIKDKSRNLTKKQYKSILRMEG